MTIFQNVRLTFGAGLIFLASTLAVAQPEAEAEAGMEVPATGAGETAIANVAAPPDPPAAKAGLLAFENLRRERLEQDIDEYRRAIAAIEENNGPYAKDLAEQFASLAGLYERAGEYAEAVKAYEHAIHVTRINYGLFTPEQIVLVRGVIRNHIFMRDFDEVRRKEAYLRYLREANSNGRAVGFAGAGPTGGQTPAR